MIAALWLACSGADPAPSVAPIGAPVTVPLTDEEAQAGRERRRMNVDQLAAALRVATGRSWTEDGEDLFERMAGSLGKPDFLDSTSEPLDPGLLFQKFLGDAAKQACSELIAEELTAPPSERRLTANVDLTVRPEQDDAATTAALIRAVLRFHGRELAADHEEIAAWRWLLDEATATSSSTAIGWQTVCVGLITHPDFYTL